ncbi:hypothetical protein PPL_04216 [Heterostelium album PN500]|uniref:Ependymin-like protein n=1 Tax=Heterostelium pallidum (strain ATCC 26659 / Pp 5 / PN500) TaxID=670386 RepID=D3B6Y5_HETP5|nr:hypothetical protein PPL_04216 [Heterostelium album PN500]EFA82528.1 hypothetical protein PPL_04216 [Heterostelium album PN500]|eukprot:XP_020434645.1 hypothetical protein PPL_04216 [Heterostelium album PN500]
MKMNIHSSECRDDLFDTVVPKQCNEHIVNYNQISLIVLLCIHSNKMFRYVVALVVLYVALASAQSPTCATYSSGYQYGYSNIGFNFVRRDHLLSYAESGGFVADVANQRQAAFFRIQFNNTDNIPIFEEGLEIMFASNNTMYIVSNGVCFLQPSYEPVVNTLVPSNVRYSNQVTLGSAKFNSYTSPIFDGQHSFFGVYEPTTCIPMHITLSNVDFTLGESTTNFFDFSTTIDENVFVLPPPCMHPIKVHEYKGFRSHVAEMMASF